MSGAHGFVLVIVKLARAGQAIAGANAHGFWHRVETLRHLCGARVSVRVRECKCGAILKRAECNDSDDEWMHYEVTREKERINFELKKTEFNWVK